MERKLKIGLVGASANGGWSPVAHIPAIKALKNVELAALCTTRPESAKAASEAFDIDRAYHDVNELVAQPDLDIISAVVKIPNHYEVVKTALEANKHVYCEWPLGASLEETEELTRLANEKGLTTAIGLQGHRAPELLYIEQLVERGWFGQVVSVRMTMQTKASSTRKSKQAWEDEKQRKTTLLSIVGGHTLYYLSHMFGGISEVAGQLTTHFKQLTLKDTGEKVDNEISDQISIHGLLRKNIPFHSQISALPHHSDGWRLEVFGTEATIIATSKMLPQITPIELVGSRGDSEFEPMPVPIELTKSNDLPSGPASNVGRNYGSMAEAIVNGETFHPNFDDALAMQRLLDTIQRSSDEKRTIQIESNGS
jgi:predicted dehydrogenase